MTASDDQQRLRSECEAARLRTRAARRDAMGEIGSVLSAWRATAGVQQQVLAQQACVSPTVVRRIEKADYESPPPRSLINAVRQLAGPADEIAALTDRYRALQAEQQGLEQMLGRSVLPPDAVRLAAEAGADGAARGLREDNVPLPDGPVIGRYREVTEMVELIGRDRLVTLLGPGGIGKTATAKVALAAVTGTRRWFVDLTAITPDEAVETFVLARVLSDESTASVSTLARTLGTDRSLVLLDNCEHRLDEVARFAADVLTHCPSVAILATSREPLGLASEVTVSLGALALSDLDADADALADRDDALTAFDAFVRAARGGAGLRAAEYPTAHALCQRLDAIPLAMQLAAGRSRSMELPDILRGLSHSLELLGGGSRAVARHHTMDAAIEWSWQHLSEREQEGLGRLATLPGAVSFGAAVAVLGDGDEAAGQALAAGLVDKSLVVSTSIDGERRVRVLWPVATYAIAHSPMDTRRVAADGARKWLHRLTDVDELELQKPDVYEGIVRQGELFSYVATAPELADADRVRLVLGAWLCFGHDRRMRPAGIAALSAADDAQELTPFERGRAFGALGHLMASSEDAEGALAATTRSVAIRRELGDVTQLRYALIGLSHRLVEVGRVTDVGEVITELYGLVGDDEPSVLVDLWATDAWMQLKQGRFDRAIELHDAAVATAEEQGMALSVAVNLANLAHSFRLAGQPAQALDAAKRAVDASANTFGDDLQNYLVVALARALLANGDSSGALATLDESAVGVDGAEGPRALEVTGTRAAAVGHAAPPAAARYLREVLVDQRPTDLAVSTLADVMWAAVTICLEAGRRAEAARLLRWHRHAFDQTDTLPIENHLANAVTGSDYLDVAPLELSREAAMAELLDVLDAVVRDSAA